MTKDLLRITILAGFFALHLLLTKPSTGLTDDTALRDKGIQLLKSGHPQDAVALLDQAIAKTPSDDVAIVWRGIARYDLRLSQEALDDANEALRLNPGSALAYHLRGTLCSRFGRYQQAISEFEETLRLDPQHPLAQQNIEDCRRNHAGVLSGEFHPPTGDLPEFARNGPRRSDPYGFWKNHGNVEDFEMRTESMPDGDGYVTIQMITLSCVRIDIPRRGRPLAVFLPLEDGTILGETVPLNCPPYVAISGEPWDMFGVAPTFTKVYLEWLYWKSGK